MQTLSMTQGSLRTIAAIIHLGNISFMQEVTDEGNIARLDTSKVCSFETVSRLLGVASEKLNKVLTVRKISARGETYEVFMIA